MNDDFQTVDHVKRLLIDLAIEFGPKLLVAIAIIVIGVYVSKWVGKVLDGGVRKFQLEPPVRQLLVRVVRIFVVAIFAIMALQNLGVQLLPLIAGLGVAGAGLALAMQGMLSNVVAGLTIIFTKPFRVGEYISIIGEEGQVENISIFTTILSHADKSMIVIPNRKLVGEILHNYGKIRQVDIKVGVAYDTNLEHAMALIHQILKDNTLVLGEPAPVVAVSDCGASAINILIRPWVNVPDYITVSGQINEAIVQVFRNEKIVMPFTQHEVRILSNN